MVRPPACPGGRVLFASCGSGQGETVLRPVHKGRTGVTWSGPGKVPVTRVSSGSGAILATGLTVGR